MTDLSNIPHEYEVSFVVEVIPEEGDTAESLIERVRQIAADDWLPEGFVFDVKAIPLKIKTRR